jgi:Ran GTPase-activating protein (RanGAP) involved in mRNA processing and transport
MLGVLNLCRGLRTNSTLKQLHMCYCDITSDAGVALSDVLENARSSLEVVNLSGNRLGGIGFEALCKGLIQNTKLLRLGLADNMIDQVNYMIYITYIFI